MDNETPAKPMIERVSIFLTRLGMVMLAVLVFFIVSAIVRHAREGRRVHKSNTCRYNIEAIWRSCQNYAAVNQNHMPPDLETLLKNSLLDPQQLICPNLKSTAAPPSSYLYFAAGFRLHDLDAKTIVIAEPKRVHGILSKESSFMIGFGDGHVELVADPGDLATIARSHGWKLPGAEKNATSGTPQAKP